MRTIVVTHYFPPEIGAPQARLSELARFWAAGGDEVTVLTGMPNHPTGVVPEDYRGRVRCEEWAGGYRIVRTWLYATPNEGVAKKTLGHLSFMVSSVVLGWRRSGPADVIVVSSPTFFSIFAAWVLAKVKGAALVVEIRDLWPAIFVELGVLTNAPTIRILEMLERWAYRTADIVVVVTEGFRDDLIRRGVPAAKVHTIPNGVDLGRFEPGGDPEPGRRWLGARDDNCLVLYIGAHGISHGLDAVLRAAGRLEGKPIQFAFVGEGSSKASLVAQAERDGLDNVVFRDGVPRDEVSGLLAAADICLVSLRDIPLFSSFIPSKIFEYLGAGKAVIGAVAGEPARILEAGGAVVVPPEDDAAMAAAIEGLADDGERRRSMGESGRRHVGAHFDREALAREYRDLLGSLTAR